MLRVVALVFAVACAGSTVPPAPTPVEPAPAPEPAPVIVGGWSAQEPAPDDATQAEAALALVRTQSGDASIALVAVRGHQTQVVAGMNHKWSLDVTTAAGPKTIEVTVYHALDHTQTLTSVTGL